MPSQHYELTFIISSKVPENEIKQVTEKVKQLITDPALGGKITNQITIGRKKFAYPINHQKHGFYETLEFDLDSEKLAKIDQELRLAKTEILRFLIIKKKVLTVKEIELQKKVITAFEKIELKRAEKPIKVVKKKISLEDLDKKLDELLDKEIVQ